MEKSIKPDKKYFTKVIWILLTVSIVVLIAMVITHLIMDYNYVEMEVIVLVWFLVVVSLIVMWLFSIPIAWLWIKNLTYVILDDAIRIYKGIITKTQQNIPFRAITDFALERTLFDRILGIGSIKIQTAGQSTNPTGYEGKLGGLINYEEWHNDLRDRVKTLHPQSEAVTVTETKGQSDSALLQAILNELKEIRKNTSR